MTLAASSTAQNFWRYVQEQGYFGSINDQLSKLLTAEGYSGPTPSSLYSLLGSLGYTGTLNERINSFEREYTIRYGNTAAWSPLALFAAAEAGVWYDPSDLSTMFQDSAGTTPVTAVGDPVGLILDKSKGLAIGSSVYSFDGSSTTGWSYPGVNGGSVASSAGALVLTCGNPLTALADRICSATLTGLTSGAWYKVAGSIRRISDPTGARLSVTSSVAAGDTTGAYASTDSSTMTAVSFYFLASATTMYLRLIALSGAGSAQVSCDDVSVVPVAGNHAYQATAASRPILRNDGTNYYLEFDGTDDFLVTSAIDFSATDKIALFFGFRKGTDNKYRMPLELSANAGSNNGTFNVLSTGGDASSPANSICITAKGTSSGAYDATTYAANSLLVLSENLNIGGATIAEEIIPRVNGATPTLAVAGTASSSGTGNFAASQPLYIGRRGGSTLAFDGRIYSLIITGRTATAAEIAAAESYVNSKTGAY